MLYEDEVNKNILYTKSEGQTITYAGKSGISETKYLLGIKVGNTIQLTDTTAIDVKQYVNTLHQSQRDEPKEQKKNDYFEQKLRLVEDFGTKKSKKIINSMMANMVSEEAIGKSNQMKKMLHKRAEQINKAEKEIIDEAKVEEILSNTSMLPLFDDNTNDPKEIYPIIGSMHVNSNSKRHL